MNTTAEIMIPDNSVIGKGLAELDLVSTSIAELKKKYSGLKINGIEDKEGYKINYAARQEVKKIRVNAEKRTKELKGVTNKVWDKIDAVGGSIVKQLLEIENPLQLNETEVDQEIERLKQEEVKKENDRVQARIDALAAYGFGVDLHDAKVMHDDMFNELLAEAKTKFDEKQEAKRLKDIEDKATADRLAEEKRIEDQRLAQERIDQENERVRLQVIADQQADAQRKLDIAAQKIEDERKQLEADKLAEAKKQADIKLAAEQAEAQKKLDLENAEKARLQAIVDEEQKALRAPDKEKLTALLDTLRTLHMPEMVTVKGKDALKVFRNTFNSAGLALKNEIASM